MRHQFASALALYLSLVLISSTHAGNIAVDASTGDTGFGSGPITVGWEFQVTQTNGITVDGLGFWDAQADGFAFSQTFPVGIWNATNGALLCSNLVTSLSPLKTSAHATGDWRVSSITPPVLLAPGLYRIGAYLPEAAANEIIFARANTQSVAGITFVRHMRQVGITTLSMPVISGSSFDSTYFGPTFTIVPPSTNSPGLVAPPAYRNAAGNIGGNTLVREFNFPRTYQMQFTPAALGLPTGARITELRIRLETNVVSSFPTNTTMWEDYEVTLAKAANTLAGMTPTFAANMLNPVLVKDGPLFLTKGTLSAGAQPNAFGTFIVFDTPYTYQGGDLVMQFSHIGSGALYSPFIDSVNTSTPGYGTSFRALSALSFHATTGIPAALAIVEIVFTYSLQETISQVGTNVVIAGTNGSPGTGYRIMTSTNAALPVSQWTPIATNTFDGTGKLRHTNAIGTSPVQLFRVTIP